MSNSRKIIAFEYLVQKLIAWYKDENNNDNYKQSFTKLKLIKLLFFVSSVEATNDNEGLLSIFDNIWAMPYGHVESDVYNSINDTKLFSITRMGIVENFELNREEYFNEIQSDKNKLDQSINRLKEINIDLINYDSFELVELSHQWQSWQTVFNLARSQKKLSLKIPKSTIQAEPKMFALPT